MASDTVWQCSMELLELIETLGERTRESTLESLDKSGIILVTMPYCAVNAISTKADMFSIKLGTPVDACSKEMVSLALDLTQLETQRREDPHVKNEEDGAESDVPKLFFFYGKSYRTVLVEGEEKCHDSLVFGSADEVVHGKARDAGWELALEVQPFTFAEPHEVKAFVKNDDGMYQKVQVLVFRLHMEDDRMVEGPGFNGG
ncbi:unnamed protein product [Discula destructiva]